MKVFEIDIDENVDGISLVSMVASPAIQQGFITLSEERVSMKLASDAEKQYVTGPVLIPNQLIYRRDEQNGEYHIKFSSQTIEKIRNKFFTSGELRLSNLEHSQEDKIQAVLIESWIVADSTHDKSVALGFSDPVIGTLFCTYHIPNKETWLVVKEKSGFSLEGTFNMVPVELSQVQDNLEDLLNELINAIKD